MFTSLSPPLAVIGLFDVISYYSKEFSFPADSCFRFFEKKNHDGLPEIPESLEQ